MSILSHRTELMNEFWRQFGIERRVSIPPFGGSIAGSSLWAAAQALERRPPNLSELAGPVVVAGLTVLGARMYCRADNAVRSRLVEELEPDC